MSYLSVFLAYSHVSPHFWTFLVTVYSVLGLSPGCAGHESPHLSGDCVCIRSQVGTLSPPGVSVGVMDQEELLFLSERAVLGAILPQWQPDSSSGKQKTGQQR